MYWNYMGWLFFTAGWMPLMSYPCEAPHLEHHTKHVEKYRDVESAQSLFYSDLLWEQAGYLEGHHLGGQAKKTI